VSANGLVEFARRRIVSLASDEDAVLVIVAKSNSWTCAWSEVEIAMEAMMEVYQAIGRMHLAEDLKQGMTEALAHAKGEGTPVVHEPKVDSND